MRRLLFISLMILVLAGCGSSNTPEETSYEFEPFEGNGFIEGSLAYPSEGIPDDLMVCADGEFGESCQYSRVEDGKFTYGIGYRIEVPEGTYRVYSKTDIGQMNPVIGGYTEAVECGLTVDCTDHTFIPVSVIDGETTTGIDVEDFQVEL